MLNRWRSRLSPTAQGSLYYLLAYASSSVYMPFLSVFYAEKGLSGTEIGLLASLGPLVGLVVTPILAALADRRGWRVRMLSVGLLGVGLCLLVLPWAANSFAMLLLLIVAMAVAASPVTSIVDGLIANTAREHNLNYGQMRLWGSVSWVIFPALGGIVWQQIGLFWMFPLSFLLCLLTIPIVQLFKEPRPVERTTERLPLAVAGDNRFRTVLLSTFLIGFGMAMSMTFASIYINSVGGQQLVGYFAGLAALIELPMMLFSERFSRRLGRAQTLLLAYGLMGGYYLGLSFIGDPVLLLGAAMLRGLGFGLFAPTTVRMVADLAPPGRSSTYQSLLNTGLWGLGPLLAGLVGGRIYDSAGPSAVFLTATGAAVAAVLVMGVAQLSGVFKHSEEPGRVSPANT